MRSKKEKNKIRREYSAGGVVYRNPKTNPPAGGQKPKIEWLVIRPKNRERWQLPKGWINEREDAQKAALREVAEEGGVKAEMVEKIDVVNFFFRYSYEGAPRELVNKTVTFFLMKYQGETERGPDPKEVEKVDWLPFKKAYQRLTFASEKKILAKGREILEKKEE